MKRLSLVLAFLGLAFIGVWAGVHFFGDTVVSEIHRNQAETIQVPTPKTDKSGEKTEEVKRYTVKIANKGGSKEMNYCADGFTEMIYYKGLEGKTLLSRHNNCGGDIVLPMEIGDHVVIENDQEYVVTDLRDTTKQITTAAINDINGAVILQSCYWHENRMKFVALTPVING